MAHTRKWTDDDLKSGVPIMPSAEQRQIDVLQERVRRLEIDLAELRNAFELHLSNRA